MSTARKYQLLVLSDPNVDESKLGIVFERLKDICDKNGAKITKTTPWGKRKLAYEIKDLREGVYHLLDLESLPGSIAKLEAFLRIQTPVLRFLTTATPE